MERVPYMNVIGSVMSTMICYRSYIAHVVSLVSKYIANPGKENRKVFKLILRYLQETPGHGLVFG